MGPRSPAPLSSLAVPVTSPPTGRHDVETPAARPLHSTRRALVGTAFGVGSALSFAAAIVLGRALAVDGLRAGIVLGVRFTSAGVVTFAILAVARRPLLPPPGERLRLVVLGFGLYFVQSLLFYRALESMSASTVSIVFYAFPALVVVIELCFGAALPDRRTAAALLLGIGGTIAVVAAGSGAGGALLTPTGVAFAVAAAAAFAFYVVLANRGVRRTDPLTATAWICFGTGVSNLAFGAVTTGLQSPAGHLPLLLANAAVAVTAFVCMFAAMRRLGTGPSSVLMTLDALFAVVLAALVLSERLSAVQALGGVAVLVAATLVATTKRSEPAAGVVTTGEFGAVSADGR